eukprot:TRINITY_DN2352_c0_g1_i2.p1 TRINITY_DN2352_c0_g1~~TRINITY_DN2352_c0_g1_i2.p1  ORF type:complete len:182 (+),score=27.01 TRINITY_DN2352_c0_g1_i2:121-666(+)
MGNKQASSKPPSSALTIDPAGRQKRGRVIKTCLVGPQKTGKSSYLSRLEHKPVSATYDQTIGVEFGLITRDIGGEPVKIQVWDTAGAPVFRSITRVSYGETASAAAVDWKQQFCTELDRHNVRNLFEVDCVQRPESVEESFAALLTMIEHLTDAYTEDFTAPGVRMHHPTSGKHLDALFMA